MIKGEFETKTVDAQKLLKESDDNIVPLVFDCTPEIDALLKKIYFCIIHSYYRI